MPVFIIVIVTIVVIVAIIAGLIPSYQRDKREAIRRFRAVGKVIQTPNGPMEYATLGEGYPVLVIHGTAGGCEQGLLVGSLLDPAQFKIIAITRSGYRRIPLATGPTFEEQADAALVVLDMLKIERVAVVSISGGGPASIQFGLRHADRCRALVLLSAHGPGTLRVFSAGLFSFVARLVNVMLSVDFPMWMMLRVPVQWALLPMGEKLAFLRDAAKLEVARGILNGGFPPSDYKAGLMNDMVQLSKLRVQPDWPLENLKAPTLILHGTSDPLVRFGAAEFHAERIPGARLIAYEGGHLIVSTHQGEVGPALAEFILNSSTI